MGGGHLPDMLCLQTGPCGHVSQVIIRFTTCMAPLLYTSFLALQLICIISSGQGTAVTFKNEDFSEGEDLSPSEQPSKFRQCRICRRRVAKYCVFCCGAFLFCGTCVKEWFCEVRAPCGYCGALVSGWSKLVNQNN